MRVGIIANPGAGGPGAMRVLADVERFVAAWADEARTVAPQGTDRLERLAAELASTVDLIIAVGGDGTLNGVVNGIVPDHADVPVAFVPAGRGKDAARTLGALSRTDLRRNGPSWTFTPVDVGRVETGDGQSRVFVNISSVGLGASAAEIASRLPRLPGTTCYLVGAGVGLLREAPFTAHLRCDDDPEIVLEQCRLLAIANCRFFGGGLHIAPMAAPNDGQLELVSVSGAGRLEILRNIPRVFKGTHMSHPALRHWRARTISVTTDPAVGIETDGEVIAGSPAAFSVLPGALRWAVLA